MTSTVPDATPEERYYAVRAAAASLPPDPSRALVTVVQVADATVLPYISRGTVPTG